VPGNPSSPAGPGWAARVWYGAVLLASVMVGVWSSASLVRGFQVAGTVAQQAMAVLVIGLVFASGVALLPAVVKLAHWRVTRRIAERVRLGEPVEKLRARESFLEEAFSVGWIVSFVVAGPGTLYSATLLCESLGLPGRLSGFWPTVISVLMVYPSIVLFAAVPLALPDLEKTLEVLADLARNAVFFAGLSLSVWIFEGVRLEGPGVGRQLLFLAVMATLFADLVFLFSVPRLGIILTLAFASAGLWALCWLSARMDVTVKISGFWTFLMATLIMAMLIRLFRPTRKTKYDIRIDNFTASSSGTFWSSG
jgi:hypothetical protein